MNIFLIFLDNNKQSYESPAQIGSISKPKENDLQQTKPHKLSLQWFKKYYIAPILRHSPDIFSAVQDFIRNRAELYRSYIKAIN